MFPSLANLNFDAPRSFHCPFDSAGRGFTFSLRVDWGLWVKELVDVRYPDAELIVLVMDNLNVHGLASLYEAFAPAEAKRIAMKLELHYTPKHGSWPNMAEIEARVLRRQCLDGRRIADRATLVRELAAWEARRNTCGAAINWRFTLDDARVKLHHLYINTALTDYL